LAKPNYQYEKRQRDLARTKKKEEKQRRKSDKRKIQPTENQNQSPDEEKTTAQ
jgi:hypothetical protein